MRNVYQSLLEVDRIVNKYQRPTFENNTITIQLNRYALFFPDYQIFLCSKSRVITLFKYYLICGILFVLLCLFVKIDML